MILNIVSKSPASHCALKECLGRIATGDAILLIEDGVLGAIDNHLNQDWLSLCPSGVALYALTEDLAARGLEPMVLSVFQQVDYAGFVALAARYPLSQSWF